MSAAIVAPRVSSLQLHWLLRNEVAMTETLMDAESQSALRTLAWQLETQKACGVITICKWVHAQRFQT